MLSHKLLLFALLVTVYCEEENSEEPEVIPVEGAPEQVDISGQLGQREKGFQNELSPPAKAKFIYTYFKCLENCLKSEDLVNGTGIIKYYNCQVFCMEEEQHDVKV
ncbi:unnamed protein product [Cylicostephanus goldi]|uniref:Uncharacterized protein n=1 Tax=Cylicostephanus goldi TaxID=71465 RepID=A0A3P6RGL8_CYLGO|nr:unnamed protein product [Cylicostephanus goldi]